MASQTSVGDFLRCGGAGDEDSYGWLYLGVYFFAIMVHFVNLHLGTGKNSRHPKRCRFFVGSGGKILEMFISDKLENESNITSQPKRSQTSNPTEILPPPKFISGGSFFFSTKNPNNPIPPLVDPLKVFPRWHTSPEVPHVLQG